MIPPRWVYRAGWWLHGLVDRLSGGRLSTAPPRNGKVGVLFLSTMGRRSGAIRRNALNYLERDDDLLLIASNAGAANDPAWWLNLQANPDATVEIGGVAREVRGRLASEQEAEEGWRRFVAASAQYTEYRSATSRQIPIIILEPRQESGQRNVPKEPPSDP